MTAILLFLKMNKGILIPVAVALAVLMLLFGVYWKGKSDQHRHEVEAAAEAQHQADLKAQEATAAADAQRANDQKAVQDENDRTKGTIDAQKDSTPSDATVAHNCRRLLKQGTDLAKIPACVRFVGTH